MNYLYKHLLLLMKTKPFENAILIFQWQPATWKTTLVRNLYADFRDIFTKIPIITKDWFKDAFFDSSPYDSSSEGKEIWRKYHAGFSYAALAETGRILSRAGLPFVVDWNFSAQFDKHVKEWRKLRWGTRPLQILQVLIGCDPKILETRLRTRLANANPEEISPANIILGVDTAIERIGTWWLPELSADHTITVDNTDPKKAYPLIKEFVEQYYVSR